ncbi:DnaD domain protein [Streptococcus sp. zg-JUN1979]|uniref:DnaD domain protein n=1 Tax=Streptococcus sp. zg-JUN1979 TaxID=3391450 RepID=UPI0039A5BACA
MMPIEHFRYVKNNQTNRDLDNLSQLYQPIIGNDAQALYLYFQSFFDNGAYDHRISDILNHLQFGMPRLEQALDMLSAMNLVSVYQNPAGAYVIKLQSVLDREQFLANSVFRKLLESRIGEVAVEELDYVLPKDLVKRSKRFSDVFGLLDEQAEAVTPNNGMTFDLASFKRLMGHDGLLFTDEQADVISIYSLSERYHMDWFDTYQLAKKTAIDGNISPSRMKVELENSKSSDKGRELNLSRPLNQKEANLVAYARRMSALEFLETAKQIKKTTVLASEKKVLHDLAQMDFLDEVINVLVSYTLAKSANLNKAYVMKIANDFVYQKIKTAEEAVIFLRDKHNKTTKTKPKVPKSNVPEWSNPDYKEEMTPEKQAEFDKLKSDMLKRLDEL